MLGMWLTDDAEIPQLDLCPTKIHTYVTTKIQTRMFTVVHNTQKLGST